MEITMIASDFKKHLIRALSCSESAQTDYRGNIYMKDNFIYSSDGTKLYKGYLNITGKLPEYRISTLGAIMIEKNLPKKGDHTVVFDFSNHKIVLKGEGVYIQEFTVLDTGAWIPSFEEIFDYQTDKNPCRGFDMENLFPVLKTVSKNRVMMEFVTYPDSGRENTEGPVIISVLEPEITGVFVVMPFIEN